VQQAGQVVVAIEAVEGDGGHRIVVLSVKLYSPARKAGLCYPKQRTIQISVDRLLILQRITHPGEPTCNASRTIIEYLRQFARIQARQSHFNLHTVLQLGGKSGQGVSLHKQHNLA
jgi:hypothetical protein